MDSFGGVRDTDPGILMQMLIPYLMQSQGLGPKMQALQALDPLARESGPLGMVAGRAMTAAIPDPNADAVTRLKALALSNFAQRQRAAHPGETYYTDPKYDPSMDPAMPSYLKNIGSMAPYEARNTLETVLQHYNALPSGTKTYREEQGLDIPVALPSTLSRY
jgi:hypothetical protein